MLPCLVVFIMRPRGYKGRAGSAGEGETKRRNDGCIWLHVGDIPECRSVCMATVTLAAYLRVFALKLNAGIVRRPSITCHGGGESGADA